MSIIGHRERNIRMSAILNCYYSCCSVAYIVHIIMFKPFGCRATLTMNYKNNPEKYSHNIEIIIRRKRALYNIAIYYLRYIEI